MSDKTEQVAKIGGWTAFLHVGSKVQAVALMVSGAIIGGTSGVGAVTVMYGTALLAGSLADFGVGTETMRFIASTPGRKEIDSALRTGARRSSIAFGLGAVAVALIGGRHEAASVVGILAGGATAASMTTQLWAQGILYGLLRFRAASLTSGLLRAGLSLGLPMCAAVGMKAAGVLAYLAVMETTIAIALVAAAARARRYATNSESQGNGNRSTPHWLGVAALTNVIINRSDTVIISMAATTAVAGTYAVASQVENAISTLALIPAGALAAFVSRSKVANQSVRTAKRLANISAGIAGAMGVLVVIVILSVGALGPEKLSAIGHGQQIAAIIICCLGAPMSAAGGVLLSAYVAVGQHKNLASAWLVASALSVPCMLLGARLAAAPGASLGALVRDAALLAIAKRLWRREQEQADSYDATESRLEIPAC